jgi:phage-related protein
MGISIYDIENWGAQSSYRKNEIVQFPSNSRDYYYCVDDHSRAAADFVTVAGSSGSGGSSGVVGSTVYNIAKWSTATAHFNDQSVPDFIWESSYGSEIIEEPRLLNIRFGEGVEYVAADGVNSDLLKYNAVFENRDLLEATAILHFLRQREGVERFSFTPPRPYGRQMYFLASEWSVVAGKREYFNISVALKQVALDPYQLIIQNIT